MTRKLQLPRLEPTVATAPRRLHSWLPVSVLALGAVSAGLLLLVEGGRKRVVDQDVALLRATAEIRLRLTTAHLWLEERLSGDPVDLSHITSNLERAQGLVVALLSGTRTLTPLRDPALVRKAQALRADIAGFRRLAEERMSRLGHGEAVGAGSDLDRQTDLFFNRSGMQAQDLEAAVEARMRRNEGRARTLFASLLVAWVSIVGTAAAGLWQRQRRQGQAEKALRQSQAQLLESQKMDALGRLAGGLAHDINNYVTAITSQCELVKMQSPADPRVARKMDLIIGTAGKIATLVRRLLTFSHRQPVAPQVVSLNGLIEGLRPMLSRLLGEDIELGTALAPDLWNVEIDPSQAEQVLLNLVVNAREASPRGGPITLETLNQRVGEEAAKGPAIPPGDYVLLAVSDTGCGIPRELRDKIFEPFFTTKEKGTASGLGLATVYGIVRHHGGAITVYSEVGRGSTFKVYLPRSFEEPACPTGRRETLPEGGPEVILLVEDNEELRDTTREILDSLGYQVIVAERGEVALEILAGETPVDLVISDVVMPGLTGSDLLERIRSLRPDLAMIFVSGYTDNVVLRHGLLEGDFQFLEKPFSPGQLAAKIRQVLEGRAGCGVR